jgi:hypothetical protein
VADQGSTAIAIWELAAREQIRHTITAYAISGDGGRLADLADQFTEDGILEVVGADTARGRAEIVTMLSQHSEAGRSVNGDVRFFVRHFVTNILVTEITPEEAHAVAYFAVFTPAGLDHWGRYRDHLVPLAGRWLLRHRTVRVDSAVEGSWYGRVHPAGQR